MLRLSKQADYGLLVLSLLARLPQGTSRSARDLADESHVPLPMTSKVLKLLTRAEILSATRGAQGGYALARPPADLTVLEIIDVLDGPVAVTECATQDGHTNCEQASACPVQGPWQRINDAIREALERVSLADMTCPVADPVGAFAGGRPPVASSIDSDTGAPSPSGTEKHA